MTRGGVYRHFQGGLYRMLFTVADVTNGRPMRPVVVYVDMRTGQLYARCEAEFHESVRKTPLDLDASCLCDARGQDYCRRHPGDTTMVPRFELVLECT